MAGFKKRIEDVLLNTHSNLPHQGAGPKRRIFVAYSGGGDSSALLHAIANSAIRDTLEIVAAHINHGLIDASDDWENHCRDFARRLGLRFESLRLSKHPQNKQNVEAWAREQRYSWLEGLSSGGDFVVTAHHLDDQLETFLLRLFRGSGPFGLSAIKPEQALGRGYLIRPMLDMTKPDIEKYLSRYEIDYIDDPSNQSLNLDRNYLRHSVLPLIQQRWPHAAEKVAQAAYLQQQLASGLERNAFALLEQISAGDGECVFVEKLKALDAQQRYFVVRAWCDRRRLGVPEGKHVREIEKILATDEPSASMRLTWKNAELRYYQGMFYLRPRERDFDPAQQFVWDMQSPLELPHGQLQKCDALSGGLSKTVLGKDCEVGFYRHEGERCHPQKRNHSQTLKKLFQSWRVPPWERQRVPIIRIEGTIAAVVPYCVCRPFAAADGDSGIALEFSPSNSLTPS